MRGWCCNMAEKHDRPAETHASALVQKKQNYYYSLLYTRDKGENFNMLLKLDRPAESHTFFHLFFTYNDKFYYSSTFNAWEIFVT